MVKLFRTNQFVANILLLLYVLILRFPALISLPEASISNEGGILFKLFFGNGLMSPSFSFYLGTFLIVVHGFLLNVIENRFKLTGELNLLPGASYILLATFIPASFYCTPLSIGIIFLILSILEILKCYKKYLPSTQIFNAGFFLSIGFLFYTSFWMFLPFAFIALGIIRNFQFREQLMFLFGFLTPITLVGTYYFWYENFGEFLNIQFWGAMAWQDWTVGKGWIEFVPIGVLSIVLMITLLNFSNFHMKKGIEQRKGIDIFYWSMVFAGLAVFIQPSLDMEHLMLLLPCLGLGLSIILIRLSETKAEAIHFVLFLAAILWQFNPWIA